MDKQDFLFSAKNEDSTLHYEQNGRYDISEEYNLTTGTRCFVVGVINAREYLARYESLMDARSAVARFIAGDNRRSSIFKL